MVDGERRRKGAEQGDEAWAWPYRTQHVIFFPAQKVRYDPRLKGAVWAVEEVPG